MVGRTQAFFSSARRVAAPLAASLTAITVISVYGLAHHDVIYALALKPRQADGLLGILTMPLVHGSFAHLLVNGSLYIVFAATVLFRGRSYFALSTAAILLTSGILLWLVGRPGAHIGMSMLIFGYFGLLATRGVFERRFASIAVSLLIVGAYASLLWGIVPGDDGVSWEGHLCGLLAGVLTARLLSGNGLTV